MNHIVLPRVTGGWLMEARWHIEEGKGALDIQRDDPTKKYRIEYSAKTGLGFWHDSITLFVERPDDPFGGIVRFAEQIVPWDCVFEYHPRSPLYPSVLRLEHATHSPGSPDWVEETHYFFTMFQMEAVDPPEISFHRTWELRTQGRGLEHRCWYEFLKLLRRNDRQRELLEKGAPKPIIEGNARLIRGALGEIAPHYPGPLQRDLEPPLSGELIQTALKAVGYTPQEIEQLFGMRGEFPNLLGDSLLLEKASWQVHVVLAEREQEWRLGFWTHHKGWEDWFIRSELGISQETLRRLMEEGRVAAGEPAGYVIDQRVRAAAKQLSRYNQRKMKLATELSEFLAWLEMA